MRRALLIATVLLLAAAPPYARAEDFWTAAADDPDAEAARRNYDKEMQNGDELALLGAQAATGAPDTKRLFMLAIKAYENASLARPDAPEPQYRAGLILRDFFVDCGVGSGIAFCNPGHSRADLAAKMADHWTAFEKLAPLDPRIDFAFLFDRAIAHTRAAEHGGKDATAHIEAALDDYQAALRRVDLGRQNTTHVRGNMAETYMMLGRLDEAIDMYGQTLRQSSDTSTMYGLAVALDRDEQGAKAREIIRAMGTATLEDFKDSVNKGDTFFVPDGEVFYYFALAEEALGDSDQAIVDWQHFIDSKAHPQFDERAAANRAALIKANKHSKRPPPDPTYEYDR